MLVSECGYSFFGMRQLQWSLSFPVHMSGAVDPLAPFVITRESG